MIPSSLVCAANCEMKHKPRLISGLPRGLNETYALLGCYAACIDC